MSHEMTSNPPMTNPMLAELDEVVRLKGYIKQSREHFDHAKSAALQFLINHHSTLADMAKRLEAAERDAKGEREESWEVWQDDMCVAGSDSLADAQHYMMMYGQDGPVKMVHVVTFRSDVIETVPADQLAIDATQEGEG